MLSSAALHSGALLVGGHGVYRATLPLLNGCLTPIKNSTYKHITTRQHLSYMYQILLISCYYHHLPPLDNSPTLICIIISPTKYTHIHQVRKCMLVTVVTNSMPPVSNCNSNSNSKFVKQQEQTHSKKCKQITHHIVF